MSRRGCRVCHGKEHDRACAEPVRHPHLLTVDARGPGAHRRRDPPFCQGCALQTRRRGARLALRAARGLHPLHSHAGRGEPRPVVARRLFAARAHAGRHGPSQPRRASTTHRSPCTFHEPKARQIHAIAVRASASSAACSRLIARCSVFQGRRPQVRGPGARDRRRGAEDQVDIHVHRVTNRWGYVRARRRSRRWRRWREAAPRALGRLNRLLVPFGKHVLHRGRRRTARRARCSSPAARWA